MRNGEYELVKAPAAYPGLKYRGKYVYEHHLVWWKKTGKIVPAGHLLHHKNGEKRDNRARNLELQERAEHSGKHSRERAPEPVCAICGWCRKSFKLMPCKLRERVKVSRSGKVFCCKSHQVSWQQTERRRRLPKHGASAYARGCRCELCRAAHAKRHREWKHARRDHGGHPHL